MSFAKMFRKSSVSGGAAAATRPSVNDNAVDNVTEMARWFVSGLTRTQVRAMAAGILDNGRTGEFLIRDKSDEPNSFAMSVKANKKGDLYTFILDRSADANSPGYCLRGSEDNVFKSVARLVKYYLEKKRPDLGIKLRVPGDYMTIYTSSGYKTQEERKAAFQQKRASVRMARSAGSLANNPDGDMSDFSEESEEEEEEDCGEGGEGGEGHMSSPVYAMAGSGGPPAPPDTKQKLAEEDNDSLGGFGDDFSDEEPATGGTALYSLAGGGGPTVRESAAMAAAEAAVAAADAAEAALSAMALSNAAPNAEGGNSNLYSLATPGNPGGGGGGGGGDPMYDMAGSGMAAASARPESALYDLAGAGMPTGARHSVHDDGGFYNSVAPAAAPSDSDTLADQARYQFVSPAGGSTNTMEGAYDNVGPGSELISAPLSSDIIDLNDMGSASAALLAAAALAEQEDDDDAEFSGFG